MGEESTNGTTTTTVEINADMSAKRFPAWMALSVFSAICLAAITSTTDGDSRGRQDNWVLSVTVISMSLSFLAVLAYLLVRGVFVGQTPELGMIFLVLIFWAGGLPVIMNPNNNVAVDEQKTVINANLYFFSWLAFAAALFLSANLAQELWGVDVSKTPTKSARWYGLCASSLVVMGAAVRSFKADNCSAEHTGADLQNCKRTKFAVSLGVISFAASLALTYLTQKGLVLTVETASTTILLCLWCFGVGYITFGESPGNTIGNLYFATWISFILCVFLFGQCFRDYMGRRSAPPTPSSSSQDDEEGVHSATSPEVPVEDDI